MQQSYIFIIAILLHSIIKYLTINYLNQIKKLALLILGTPTCDK